MGARNARGHTFQSRLAVTRYSGFTPPAALAGYSLAALFLPSLTVVGRPSGGSVLAACAAVATAIGVAALVASRESQPTYAWLGGLIVLTAGWLVSQTSQPEVTWLLGLIIGVALGLATPGPGQLRDRSTAAFFALGGLQFGLLTLFAPGVAGMAGGALYCSAMLALAVAGRERPRPGLATGLLAVGVVVLTLGTAGWIGANSRSASWFGSLVNHGAREGRAVAITFDDGPNVRYTLPIRDILDRYGVKATFFTVGKAVDARPDISRSLMSDGELIGNHSYLHDALRWLDPGYPELERAQRAFRRQLGVCPTFFRPPHGQHTSFMADVVADHGMTMVGWDDSGRDWATRDARLVAARILKRARPGSIILLHDGLDGDLRADRSVLLTALPLILDGLEARGLRAVRLDKLLRKPGYGNHC